MKDYYRWMWGYGCPPTLDVWTKTKTVQPPELLCCHIKGWMRDAATMFDITCTLSFPMHNTQNTLSAEVFSGRRESGLAKVMPRRSNIICELNLPFESWPLHLIEITHFFCTLFFDQSSIACLTRSLLSSGNWRPNWGTLESCLSPWQRCPADNHCLLD